MSVEIYQGSIVANSVSNFNNAVNALFQAAGYSVTTDTSAKLITVNNSSAIFGLSQIHLANSWDPGNIGNSTWNLVIDKDQKTLILVSSAAVAAYEATEAKFRMAVVSGGKDIYADGSLSATNTKIYEVWNVPNVNVSRTSGQPVVLTVAVDKQTKSIDAPIFIAANGILYPLGTIIQDGSAKFVSDGNGLAIRVKE